MLFHTASPPNSLKKTRTKRWMKVSPLLSLTAFYVVLYILRRPIELTWIHWFMISHTNIFSMLTFFPWLSCIGSQQSRGQLYCVKSSISNVKEYKMHIYIYIYIANLNAWLELEFRKEDLWITGNTQNLIFVLPTQKPQVWTLSDKLINLF